MPDNTVHIYPSLAYADVGRAVKWLARAFGFELTLEIKGDEHAQAYAELRLVTVTRGSCSAARIR